MIPHHLNILGLNRNFLTIISNQAGSTIQLTTFGQPSPIDLYYKKNNSTWIKYNINDIITLQNINDKVKFWNKTNTFSKKANYYKFVMTGIISVSGNIMSLINFSQLTQYCFSGLFFNCSSIISISQNLLPATKLSAGCYFMLFQLCNNLLEILQKLLPAINLANAPYCYDHMFNSNEKLTSLPQNLLPATTLSNYCYTRMFEHCINLSSVTAKFDNWNENINSTYMWLSKVAFSGTFYYTSDSLDITKFDCDHIQTNWTPIKI